MQIPIGDVAVPGEVLVGYLIPPNYRNIFKVKSVNGGEFFSINKGKKILAAVSIREGAFNVEFVGDTTKNELYVVLNAEYFFNEELLWVVLFPDSFNSWTFIGVPEKSKEAAIGWVSPSASEKMCVLVSFQKRHWRDGVMRVKSANYLIGDFPKLKVDDTQNGMIYFRISPMF